MHLLILLCDQRGRYLQYGGKLINTHSDMLAQNDIRLLTSGAVYCLMLALQINWILLISRQGKVRLAKWFTTMSPKAKLKITKDVTQLVLARRTRMCNFLEYKDSKVVYRRYASLFFVTGISQGDNELVTLEIIHRYVEVLDRYFGNVCELDLIFNFQKAYAVSMGCPRAIAIRLCLMFIDQWIYFAATITIADSRRAHHCRRNARIFQKVRVADRQSERFDRRSRAVRRCTLFLTFALCPARDSLRKDMSSCH